MKVVVHMFGGAMFVVQSILWCGMGVVYGVYLVKSGMYLTIPFFIFFLSHNPVRSIGQLLVTVAHTRPRPQRDP